MRKFAIDGKDFIIDGKKDTLRSGAIHYFRIPSYYWRDRLLKLKECGLNCVETYIAWNIHEEKEGKFDFSGEKDVGKFLDIAAELGLLAIVRPGPYICAEWECGGFPPWLLSKPSVRLRCSESQYLKSVKRYLSEVCSVLQPRLISANGNVIMVQVENEYGSYGNDKVYLQELAATLRSNLPGCVLFTSDGADRSILDGGTLPDLLTTVIFGSSVKKNFDKLREYLGNEQPMMCAEFWCGWFDSWGEKHHTRSVSE